MRGPPASSASSRPAAARRVFPPRACGPTSPTTSPAPRTTRPRSLWCAGSSRSSTTTGTSVSWRRPPRATTSSSTPSSSRTRRSRRISRSSRPGTRRQPSPRRRGRAISPPPPTSSPRSSASSASNRPRRQTKSSDEPSSSTYSYASVDDPDPFRPPEIEVVAGAGQDGAGGEDEEGRADPGDIRHHTREPADHEELEQDDGEKE